ncbi:MAG: cold shock domain-containing protein [Methanobrevibacter sp.]|nr:cold shock domain-containing protein [Methanobrevibacter sp.]
MKGNTPKQELFHAHRLYTNNRPERAESIYMDLFTTNRNDFTRRDLIEFMWTVNRNHIRNYTSKEELTTAVDFIMENFSQEDCSKRNFNDPYADSLLRASDRLIEEKDYMASIRYLIKLDENYLSNVSRYMRRNSCHLYSHHERYMTNMVKSLTAIEKYDAALEYSIRLINDLPDTKSDAKYWIKWSMAKIYHKMGDYDISIECINELKNKRNESYFQKALSDNYRMKGDYRRALVNGVNYVMMKNDIRACVNYFTVLADILEKMGYTKEALSYYYLAYTIKKAGGSFIPVGLEQRIESSGLDMDNTDYKGIVVALKPFWNRIRYMDREQFTGTIDYIREDKGFGFIRPDSGGKNQFFSFRDFNDNRDYIWNNMRVSYYLEDSYDYSKGTESTKAVNVELI